MPRRFNMHKFIKDILNDKYALIIGNEIILDEAVEPSCDIHKYLLRKVNEMSSVEYADYYDVALDKSERINPIRQLVEAGEIDFNADSVSKDLASLLETRLFTTILTTTTDGFLESLLRKIWGKELRVVNVYDKDTVDDLQKAQKSCRRGHRYNQPTLIYVFGKMDEDDLTKRYIRTESDAIMLIEKWMRMDVESNNELLEFIRSKRLLALGCKYDNWFFRFFWYVLTGSIDSERFEGTGEVAFTLDVSERSDEKLKQFLERTNICVLGDASAFLRQVKNLLTEESEDAPFRRQIMDIRRRGGIFISYCSKDALSASQLFFQLYEKRYDVWLDNARLYGGDDYEQEIYDAINAAKIFIPLLSPSVAEDLKCGDTDHYYNKEWRIAQQFNDKVIIPVAVNGYDMRSDYHQEFEKIIKHALTGTDLMASDGFQKTISSINEHL